ncbi:MAG TPA: DUF1552 domain-containing protein [Polyangiaceae bacterium]|jgi:hypothetical protein|nr:DUF1552 domain-containing protein [Polyangiaceae bacterium]
MFRRNLMARREVLKSALGGLLLAPFLRQRELQAEQTNPKRLVLLFTPDSQPPEWWPTGGGSEFSLREPLLDFSGLEKDLLFVQQVDHSWTEDNHHEAGMAQLFTGGRFYDEISRYSTHASIDQVLLQNTNLRDNTPRASLNLSVGQDNFQMRHIIAYSGANQPIQNQFDPAAAYRDVFEGIVFSDVPSSAASDPLASAKQAIDQRIVQVDTDQLRYLQRFLGQEERERLDVHVDSLRDLNARLEASSEVSHVPAAPLGACQVLETAGIEFELGDTEKVEKWAKLQCDIIVNAFNCDVTRVAGLQFGRSGGGHEGLLGLQDNWHLAVAHLSASDDSVAVGDETMTTRAAFIRFSRFWASQIAYLVKSLAAIPEGDGRMLDNTLLYWGVESGTNHSHAPGDMQYLLIGGRNMGFQVGQYLQLPSPEIANKLHTAVMQGFGYDAKGCGVEETCGALAGIVA